jgi:hypothetical protein
MYHKGRFVPKNPMKYAGDPTMVIYRSSWEVKFMAWADRNPNVLKWSSEETVIPYICPTDNKLHRYFVDFQIQTRNKAGVLKTFLIEVKPYKQTIPPVPQQRVTKQYLTEVLTWGKNDAKWKAARDFCKDRGWEFVILTEKELGIK